MKLSSILALATGALAGSVAFDPEDKSNLTRRDGWDNPSCGSKKEPHSCWAQCNADTKLPTHDKQVLIPFPWCYLADEIGRPSFCTSNEDCAGLNDGRPGLWCRSEELDRGGCS